MSLVVSKEGKHISKINYLPQPQLRKSFPFFAPLQTRCYIWPLWWHWSFSSGFYQVVTRKLKWYSVLYSTGSYRVSTCNYSRGSQYVVQDYLLMLTKWLFAARSDISPTPCISYQVVCLKTEPNFSYQTRVPPELVSMPSGVRTQTINTVYI